MGQTFTAADNVAAGDLPAGFKQDVKQAVAMAVALGWKLIVSGKESMTIVAPPPNEHKKYHLTKRRNSGPIQRIRKDIIKYADPLKLAMVDGVLAGTTDPDLVNPFDGAEVEFQDLRDEQAVEQKKNERAERKSKTAVAEALERAEANKKVKETKKTRHVVSEGPMQVNSGGGRKADSPIGIERHWSDGTTDYKCKFCDFTTPKRFGLNGHSKAHNVKASVVSPPAAEAQAEAPVEAAAPVVAEPTADAGPTDSEILDQIRGLVGGRNAAQEAEIAELTAEIERLRDYLGGLETEVEKSQERADNAEGKLRALYDLLGSEINTQDTPDK